MAKNYVIHNRNNYNLGLGNHIDGDGDLDAQYALLRNVALTGTVVNGNFVSKNKKHFGWIVECAKKGCPICNGIFKDAKKDDYTIKPFYMDKVVKIDKDTGRVIEKRKPTKWDKLAKATTTIKKNKDPDQHPLYDLIIEKFTNKGE